MGPSYSQVGDEDINIFSGDDADNELDLLSPEQTALADTQELVGGINSLGITVELKRAIERKSRE